MYIDKMPKLKIKSTVFCPINTEEDALNALSVLERTVFDWIQNVHTPSIDELSVHHDNIQSIRRLLASLQCEKRGLELRLASLQASHDQLLAKHNEVISKLDDVERANISLKSEVDDLKSRIQALEPGAAVIEAASVVNAAEQRFLDLLIKDPQERKLYKQVRGVIYDIGADEASDALCSSWKKYKKYWPQKNMSILLDSLSRTRGSIVHKEDRDPVYYRGLTSEYVRDIMKEAYFCSGGSSYDIDDELIELVVSIHSLTLDKNIN